LSVAQRLLIPHGMTITLDVIAASVAPDTEVVPEPEPQLPAVLPEPSGVFLIHTAPSPKLDPSAKDLDKVTIVIE
jgi:hypothetical protein